MLVLGFPPGGLLLAAGGLAWLGLYTFRIIVPARYGMAGGAAAHAATSLSWRAVAAEAAEQPLHLNALMWSTLAPYVIACAYARLAHGGRRAAGSITTTAATEADGRASGSLKAPMGSSSSSPHRSTAKAAPAEPERCARSAASGSGPQSALDAVLARAAGAATPQVLSPRMQALLSYRSVFQHATVSVKFDSAGNQQAPYAQLATKGRRVVAQVVQRGQGLALQAAVVSACKACGCRGCSLQAGNAHWLAHDAPGMPAAAACQSNCRRVAQAHQYD